MVVMMQDNYCRLFISGIDIGAIDLEKIQLIVNLENEGVRLVRMEKLAKEFSAECEVIYLESQIVKELTAERFIKVFENYANQMFDIDYPDDAIKFIRPKPPKPKLKRILWLVANNQRIFFNKIFNKIFNRYPAGFVGSNRGRHFNRKRNCK